MLWRLKHQIYKTKTDKLKILKKLSKKPKLLNVCTNCNCCCCGLRYHCNWTCFEVVKMNLIFLKIFMISNDSINLNLTDLLKPFTIILKKIQYKIKFIILSERLVALSIILRLYSLTALFCNAIFCAVGCRAFYMIYDVIVMFKTRLVFNL